MDYKNTLQDYYNLVEKLLDINNKTKSLRIVKKGGVAFLESICHVPLDKKTDYYIIENGSTLKVMNKNGYPRGIGMISVEKKLLDENELEKEIAKIHKSFKNSLDKVNESLRAIKYKMDQCVALIEDFREPIINYLNSKNLPCSNLQIKESAIIHITIDGKDRPIYEVRDFLPVKLRQYKGRGYSMIPHDYKKELRNFLREQNKLKEFIF